MTSMSIRSCAVDQPAVEVYSERVSPTEVSVPFGAITERMITAWIASPWYRPVSSVACVVAAALRSTGELQRGWTKETWLRILAARPFKDQGLPSWYHVARLASDRPSGDVTSAPASLADRCQPLLGAETVHPLARRS